MFHQIGMTIPLMYDRRSFTIDTDAPVVQNFNLVWVCQTYSSYTVAIFLLGMWQLVLVEDIVMRSLLVGDTAGLDHLLQTTFVHERDNVAYNVF